MRGRALTFQGIITDGMESANLNRTLSQTE